MRFNYKNFKKILLLYFWREGEGGRKGGRETSMCKRYMDWLPLVRPLLGTWPATQACALTGNQTGDPLVHRPALNPLSLTSQGFFSFSLSSTKRYNVKIKK